ncbi:MAG: virulence RhuM family protein, partial [Ignavibacteria bacterium]|nr:virulence RhuM family protein [Ignavibacteria bacterium]
MNSVEIYRDQESKIEVEVSFDDDSVWLSQNQIAALFGQTKQNISLHISNIYREKELARGSTVKESLTVQKEGKRTVKRNVTNYNLDVIISVGYRVKSKQGVLFRQWATTRLKELLVEGYTLSIKRLERQNQKVQELRNTVDIISRISKDRGLQHSEATGLLDVIRQYTFALDTLDEYDYKAVPSWKRSQRKVVRITYDECISIIDQLKLKFGSSELFGREKDNSFRSSIETLFQTFDKKELYPSIEEKSAMLLYLI